MQLSDIHFHKFLFFSCFSRGLFIYFIDEIGFLKLKYLHHEYYANDLGTSVPPV